jgi:hypothetical protein
MTKTLEIDEYTVDCSCYTPDDYQNALELLFPDEDAELEVHPWMDEMLQRHSTELVDRIGVEKIQGSELVELLKNELLTVMTIGLTMGENSGEDR